MGVDYVITNREFAGGQYTGRSAQNGELRFIAHGSAGEISGRDMVNELTHQLAEISFSGSTPRILLAIHGYNTDHESAIQHFERVADMVSDQVDGLVVIGYSWASQGSVAHYLDDRQEAREAAESLARIIVLAGNEAMGERCDTELVITAHSMGNYVLAKAASRVAEYLGYPASYQMFSEVIMLGADIDSEAFKPNRVAGSIPTFARRVTVYYNRLDRVLVASSVKRAGVTGARLGRTGPDGCQWPNVVAVDVTDIARGEHSQHGAYFELGEISDDISEVILGVDRHECHNRVIVGENRFALVRRQNHE